MCALHRERLDSWGDVGTPVAALRERYGPAFDFGCQSMAPERWWEDEAAGGGRGFVREGTRTLENLKTKESFANLERRCARFREYLLARDEACLAVVGHSAFFKMLLGERSKMANCDVVEAVVTRDGVRRVQGGRAEVQRA